MTSGPLARTPYEVLGVTADATEIELRAAYRRRLRQTHPDTGGLAVEFHAVQAAWELVGTTEARAAYDGGLAPVGEGRTTWAPAPPPHRRDTRAQTRSYGHPGGWRRERYRAMLQEWVGRGVAVPDPYDPVLLRSAPREVRRLLAAAIAEEETAKELSRLGIAFTVWHDLASGAALDRAGKLDHLVLGPTGLWAIASEDFGGEVRVRRGELLLPEGRAGAPAHDLAVRARAFARTARIRVSALLVVVPEGQSVEGVAAIGSVRGTPALLVQRPRLVDLLRTGLHGVGTGGTDLFEVRTRVQSAATFV